MRVLRIELGGEEVEITPSLFLANLPLRKIIFRKAREGDKEVAQWLWDNFSYRELTYEEIDAINKELENGKICRNNFRGSSTPIKIKSSQST